MNPWTEKSTKKRGRHVIISEILETAKKGTLKTRIMYKINLNFSQANEYFELLLDTNLMDKTSENGKVIYKTTAKGIEFLQCYREIEEIIKTEDDNNCKNGIKIPPLELLKNIH